MLSSDAVPVTAVERTLIVPVVLASSAIRFAAETVASVTVIV